MEPIAQVAQLPNGQIAMKHPPGKDLIWLIGWLDMVKDAVKQQITAQAQQTIAVPDAATRNTLLNGRG